MSKGITVKKDEDFSEWYTQVVSPEGAALADNRYDVKGAIVHLPWGYKIARNIYRTLEKVIEKRGHEPFLFPVFTHKSNLDKEEEHSGFAPEVFWVTKGGDKDLEEPLALRPTGETQIYPRYAEWLRSHAQLPMKYYQSRHTVYRYESHARPFLRGREFLFFETHNVFETHEEALQSIEDDKETMESVIRDTFKIPFKFLKRPSWDKFLGADNTYVGDCIMPDGKRNQISSTHDLGTNFAEAFDLTYADEEGNHRNPYQTCFGPGIWRIIAAAIGIHGDNKGLILPSTLAPTQVVITPILFDNEDTNQKILEVCNRIKNESSLRVHIDTRDKNPGWKFNQWEMKGVPLRLEIGPRDLENEEAVLCRRTQSEKTTVDLNSVVATLPSELHGVDADLDAQAEAYMTDRVSTAKTIQDVSEAIEHGFVKAPFYDIEGEEAEQYADTLQEEVPGAQICGVEPNAAPKDCGTCIVSGKKAKYEVYIAKSY